MDGWTYRQYSYCIDDSIFWYIVNLHHVTPRGIQLVQMDGWMDVHLEMWFFLS